VGIFNFLKRKPTSVSEQVADVLPALSASVSESIKALYPDVDSWLNKERTSARAYSAAVTVGSTWTEAMREYVSMLEDSIILGALELMCDDAFQFDNVSGRVFWAKSENPLVEVAINEMFSRINHDRVCWQLGFEMILFGTKIVKPIFANEDDFSGGVVSLDDSIALGTIEPLKKDGQVVGYVGESGKLHYPWEYLILSQPSIPRVRTAFTLRNKEFVYKGKTVRNTFMPGISVLEGARRVWRTLRVLEDAVVVSRMENAPNRKLFLIRVGQKASNKDTATLVNYYKSILEDRRSFSPASGLDTMPEKFGFSNDIYLPIKGDLNSFELKDLGQGRDIGSIVDLEFFKNRLFAALKVPQSVLGFTDSLPSSLGQSALVRLEIRYARLVKRIKRSYQAFLQQLCMVHCFSLGMYIKESDFVIQSMEVSTAEEEERNNALSKLTETMESLLRFAASLGKVNMNYLSRYILQSFLNLPNFDVDKFLTQDSSAQDKELDASGDVDVSNWHKGLGSSASVLEGWGAINGAHTEGLRLARCLPEQFSFLLGREEPFSVVVDVFDFGYSCRPNLAYAGSVSEGSFTEEPIDFGDIARDVVFAVRSFRVDTGQERLRAIKLRVVQFDGTDRFVVSEDTSAAAFLALQERRVARCMVERTAG